MSSLWETQWVNNSFESIMISMQWKKNLGFPQTVQLGKYRISRHCLRLGGVGKRKEEKKKKWVKFIKKGKKEHKSCWELEKSCLPSFFYGHQIIQIKHEIPCKTLMTLLKLGQLRCWETTKFSFSPSDIHVSKYLNWQVSCLQDQHSRQTVP